MRLETNFGVNSIVAVIRSFQGKATHETFNDEKFVKGVVGPVRKLLSTAPAQLTGIIIVSAADTNSPAGEVVLDGKTPTMRAVERHLEAEVASGFVETIACKDWGLNFGSGTALNAGAWRAVERRADTVLMWSPEIDLTGHRLSLMVNHMESNSLQLCGYARNGWTERLQWMFVQNTVALWRLDLLKAINGFDPVCNGDGKTTVDTKEFGLVPLAGMEDYHAYLRASLHYDTMLPWGFVGVRDPALWDLSAKLPGTEEYERNAQKIARQTNVMHAYAEKYYPGYAHPLEVWREIAKRMKIA